MKLELVTAPIVEPVSLDDMKDHLKVEVVDDDDLITDLIVSARQKAEEITSRAFITETWKLHLDCFPREHWIEIPRPRLQSVAHVKYFDDDDAETTLAVSNYYVDKKREPGMVVLRNDASWPEDTLRAANGVEIQFVAGYGATSAAVPETIRSWIKLEAANQYELRIPELAGTVAARRGSVDQLLASARIRRF